MITINNLNIQYNHQSIITKDHLSFDHSKLIGLYGKSGCGKTSLLNFLNLEYEFGELIIDDQNLFSLTKEKQVEYRYQNITYISQSHTFIPGMKCFDLLDFAIHASSSPYSKEDLLKKVGIGIITSNTTVKNLSMGQRALFALAYAIAKDDPILLLDEILSSIDHQNVIEIMKLLKELANQGKYIIVSFHNDIYKKYFDEIYLFDNHTIEKEINREIVVKERKEKSVKSIDQKLLRRSFLHYHLFSSVLELLIFTLFISISVIIYLNNQNLMNYIDHIESMINRTHYSIVTDNHIGNLDPFNSIGLKEESIEQIQSLEEVETVQPGIIFYIDPYYNYLEGACDTDPDIYKVYVNKEVKFLSSPVDLDEYFYIYPYLDSYLDNMCEGNINQEGEFYLYKDMANRLGIEDPSQEYDITLTVLIPQTCREDVVKGSSSTYGDFEYISQYNYVSKKQITVKVRGIFDTYYSSDFSNTIGLLSYETMYDLYLDNLDENSNYNIQEYLIETKEGVKPAEIRQKIKAIDGDIAIIMNGEDTLSYWDNTVGNNEKFVKMSYALIGVCVVGAIALSIINYFEEKKYFSILTKLGIDHKTIRKIRVFKLMIMPFFYLLTVVLLSIIVQRYMMNEYILINMFSQSYLLIIEYSVILTIIIYCIMNSLTLFTLGKKYYD